jgi:hypothetical protein
MPQASMATGAKRGVRKNNLHVLKSNQGQNCRRKAAAAAAAEQWQT